MVALRAEGFSYRAIARELQMSLAGVQRSLRRATHHTFRGPDSDPADAAVAQELAEILADLRADPADELALYRLRHIPRDTPGHPWPPAVDDW